MRPTYRLYIDESGDHTYGRKERKPFVLLSQDKKVFETSIDSYPQLERGDKRYLGLTGCIIKLDYYRNELVPVFEAFKRDFFDPDENVILHAKEIIQRQGHFHVLQNKEVSDRFDAGLLDIVANAEYAIINVVIDKKNHVENYGTVAWHPYHYCLANMLERYCYFLKKRKARGDMLAESRGKGEDFELKKAYATIYEKGTRFKSQKFFQQYITSKEIKIKPKEKNVVGLQLADILANPLKKYTLIQKNIIREPDESVFWLKIVEAAKRKLDCRESDGCVDGYGLVFIK